MPHLRESTRQFLIDLAANNGRQWFDANRPRYEEARADFISLIGILLHEIEKFDPSLAGQEAKNSVFRIYRDTRFSKNKTPYKTNIGIQFRHERAKDVHSPGFYVHIAPEEVFIGVGMWRPDPDSLRAIRERIAAKPAEWQRTVGEAKFKRKFELGGEVLTRPPRGFDKEQECIEDIKRKSFIAVQSLAVEDCLNPQFQRKVETAFKAGTPYMQFLCKAVGVQF